MDEEQEKRLMGRINTLQETMIERFRAVDLMLASQMELTRSTNTLLQMLVNSSLDHAERISKLEKKS